MKVLNFMFVLALIAIGTNKLFAQNDTVRTDPLKEIFTAYLGVEISLAKENEDEAGVSGKKLYNLLNAFSMDKPTDEQFNAWTKNSKKILNDADHIAEMTILEHQREHFNKLSKGLFEVVKAFKTNTNNIYYHYCPEAHDGKGACWLSDNEKGGNPYFGDKKPDCDSLKEIIKGNL